MSERSNISWCDSSFSPWIGCTKVSPGCDGCYAEALMDKRMGRVTWGAGQERKRTSEAYWRFVKAFRDARERAGPAAITARGEAWQFRDLRAKAGTDKADEGGIREAQRLLGHASITTTEGYLRSRRGERVRPGK